MADNIIDPLVVAESAIPDSVLTNDLTVTETGAIVPNVEVPKLKTVTLGEVISSRNVIAKGKHMVTVEEYSNGISVVTPHSFAGSSFVYEGLSEDEVDAALDTSEFIP